MPVCIKRKSSFNHPMGTMPPTLSCNTLGCPPGERCVQKSYVSRSFSAILFFWFWSAYWRGLNARLLTVDTMRNTIDASTDVRRLVKISDRLEYSARNESLKWIFSYVIRNADRVDVDARWDTTELRKERVEWSAHEHSADSKHFFNSVNWR